MTEREKMLAGMDYNSRDPELMALYRRAKEALFRHNHTRPDEEDPMLALRGLLGILGQGVWIEAPFFCEYGCHISIGENTYVNVNCFFQDNARITVGRDCLIGPGVQLCAARHPLAMAARIRHDPPAGQAPYTTSSLPITIGDGCWLGANVVVIGGVSIGEGCVVGAGSVVTRDLPPHSVCHGVPSRPQGPTASKTPKKSTEEPGIDDSCGRRFGGP
jgi:maltose O-acetyltransferase